MAATERLSDGRRAQRFAEYEKVMALHAKGGTMKGIGVELAIDHRTVRKFIMSGSFPQQARRARGSTLLDAHVHYMKERIAQGCRCPRQTWREVRQRPSGFVTALSQRGYAGGRATVQSFVVRLQSPQGEPTLAWAPARKMPCPSSRRAFGWFV